ncbi:MAG: BON domain-containing protein [Candidatus Dormibacteraeota bacterium]|uniref:BON domain-containing protein n=1 Tax=Candidatus Nephthysia bennettiae TaxID=3127016 RepID=A0A934K8K1_9BACT|nr:BON domain-containing protein [Candidatus Dormibacteraeota bacterium]MBJ7611891.1 BON domain-containing protein [Candidatus Dormibacteraeota bacterium]
MFCTDYQGPVGRVERSGGDAAEEQPLLVATGWWRRIVRRVPSRSVLTADRGEVRLSASRAEFLELPHFLSDDEVVAAVRSSFTESLPFRSSRVASIRVTSRDGAVTLSGHVAHDGHRREAVRSAQNADGVVGVSDRLVSDEHLTSAVARSFLAHPGLQPSLVRVSARLGAVVLDGELPSEDLIRLASSSATAVAGVTTLESRLRLPAPRGATPRPPA